MAIGVPAVRRIEVPARPEREAQERGGRSTSEMVVLADEVERAAGMGHRAGHIAEEPGQSGTVDGDRTPAARGTPASSTTTIADGRASVRSRLGRGPASARRPAGAPRRPRVSPRTRSDPAYPLLSTGRTRISSSGSASSQRRSVASWRARRVAGIASSTRSAARSKSWPAIAWRIASDRSPFCSYHSLARRCSSGNVLGLLVQQARLQHVGEEVVVAIPPTPVVERDEEQVPSIERLQRRLAAALAGDGVAQRPAQPGQDRGLQQEAPDVARADAAGPPRPGSRRCSGRPRRSLR